MVCGASLVRGMNVVFFVTFGSNDQESRQPIYGKNPSTFFSPEPEDQFPRNLVCINWHSVPSYDDPRLIVTYFTAMPIFANFCNIGFSVGKSENNVVVF